LNSDVVSIQGEQELRVSQLPDETNKEIEMRFSVSLQVNARCLIKNVSINLLEIAFIVKNYKKALHCSIKKVDPRGIRKCRLTCHKF
jgi:hypothetical protein